MKPTPRGSRVASNNNSKQQTVHTINDAASQEIIGLNLVVARLLTEKATREEAEVKTELALKRQFKDTQKLLHFGQSIATGASVSTSAAQLALLQTAMSQQSTNHDLFVS